MRYFGFNSFVNSRDLETAARGRASTKFMTDSESPTPVSVCFDGELVAGTFAT